jgi:putative ABC transport system permease protein
VEHYALDGSVGEKPQIYYSFYQLPDEAVPAFASQVTLAVRTSLDVAAAMPAIKKEVYAAGADQPVYNTQTMQDVVSRSMGRQRFPTVLLVVFAGLALVLACVGTYGVISYSTSQRMHEIGIRMAVGASRMDVVQMIVGQGIRLSLIGIVIGTLGALMFGRALPSFSHLLYGVESSDPLTLVFTSLALMSTAILACFIPARRASRLDPAIALRNE